MSPFLGILLVVGMLVLVVFLRQSTIKKRNEHFEQLAQRLGLNYQSPANSWWQETYPSIEGELINRRVQVSMFGRGGYRHRRYYTAISVSCENGHHTFGLSREDMFGKIGKFFGGQDIEIGDTAFDKTFLIKGSDVFFIKKILNSNGKRLINNHQTILRGKLELKPNELYYEEMREIDDLDNAKIFELLIKMMVEFSTHIESVE